MKKKVLLFLLVCGLVLGFTSTSKALPIEPGPFYLDYTNYEVLSDPNTGSWNVSGQEDNWGIIDVNYYDLGVGSGTGITKTGYPNTWDKGDSGNELTGIFYGIDIVKLVPGAGTNYTSSIGGRLDIYENAINTLDYTTMATSDRVGPSGFTNITDTGTLWLSMEFVPGVATDANYNYTISGTTDSLSLPMTGNLSYYFRITGGSMAGNFDNSYYSLLQYDGSTLDAAFFGKNSFSPIDPTTTGGFTYQSQDPIMGFAVPEPATMLLLGTGLIGLAVIGRKKRFFKKD